MTKQKNALPVLEVAPGVQLVHGRAVPDREVERQLAPAVTEVRKAVAQVRNALVQEKAAKS